MVAHCLTNGLHVLFLRLVKLDQAQRFSSSGTSSTLRFASRRSRTKEAGRLAQMRFVRRFGLLVVLSSQKFSKDNSGLMAAAISYWALFSVLPLLLLLLGLTGIVLQDSGSQSKAVDEVLNLLPFSEERGRQEVTNAIESISSARGGVFGVLGLLFAAWSGSNMFGAIRRSLNVLFGDEGRRPPLHEKLIDLVLVAALAPFFLASIAATALLRSARRASEALPLIGDLTGATSLGWDVISLLVPMVISCTAFAILYWLAPAKRQPLGIIFPGAVVAAILFELSKFGFSIYLENFATHEVVYGSLGAVVAFFVWVYLTSSVLLFGAEVACQYPRIAALEHENLGAMGYGRGGLKTTLLRLMRSLVTRG